jgi:OmpA-OmpF porin, OOP family
MLKKFFSSFLLLMSLLSNAQNLVPNGSFEEREFCPTDINRASLKVIKQWSQLNEGTPDYFSSCGTRVGVPSNMFGHQPAHTGGSYAGLVIYSSTKRNYREYLSAKLTRPLQSGEQVCIEMHLSPADFDLHVADAIGVYLSKTKPVQERTNVVVTMASMANPALNMLDGTDEWLLVSDTYTAKGGEEYITIGNFKPDRETMALRRTSAQGANENNLWSYIYIDDVAVKPIQNKAECSCENDYIRSTVHDPPLELSEYDDIRLDAVLFDFDQDILTAEASAQLDDVYKLLRKNKSMYMVISGHTDIIGPDGYNLSLSRRRAEKVIGFLTAKGISLERLTVEYEGSKKPVADNTTPEGRAQNRRVEFNIRQKRYERIITS